MLEVTTTIKIPLEEFDWSFARSGGPGGQNVNKVASKAVLRWNFAATTTVPNIVKERFQGLFGSRLTTEGELVISSELTRDQSRNREDCLEKLVEMLRIAATPPKIRHATRPSRASKKRRVADKRHTSATKNARRTPKSDD